LSKQEANEIIQDCWQNQHYMGQIYSLSTIGLAIETIRSRKSSTKSELEYADHIEKRYLEIKYSA